MNSLPLNSLPLIALQLAELAHLGQYRRDGVTPYISHIKAVMDRAPKDPVSQAVAILHDSWEDDCVTPLSDANLRAAGMPDEVIAGRDTLTRRNGETYEAYILRIKETDGGRWIEEKVSDILANLSETPTKKQIIKYAKALLILLS